MRRHGPAMFVAGAEEAVLLRVLQVPPCSLPASGVAMDLQAVARLPRPQFPLCPVSRRHGPHRRPWPELERGRDRDRKNR